MRKASRIMLLIWDILLLPCILLMLAMPLIWSDTFDAVLSVIPEFVETIFIMLCLLSVALSFYWIPQIISLILIALSWIMPYRVWEPSPTRKELVHLILLSIFAIAGAVCAILLTFLFTGGEAGVPIG